ncbi:hypothetical protein [uncultured Thiohalocapsa sp.]|jgi:hypothetical protein|uniref:hypothetical protein n=1 Tax=uncultured Thiohalocapsa sp. TaxID=768990 RepID=UPI0025F9DD72|nr:hypothetical protein [uncultured Thiohalocapsa sp.]
MLDLMLLIPAASISCYVMLGLHKLAPGWVPVPKDRHHHFEGVLYLLIAVAAAVKLLWPGH